MRSNAGRWIIDTLRNARRARVFVGELTPEALAADEPRLHGAPHALTLVGGAAKRVSPEGRARFPAVPWKAMAGLRGVIVHRYDELDVEAIHRTATRDAEHLIRQPPSLLTALDSGDDER